MKVSVKVCGAVCAALLFVGCGSSPKNEPAKPAAPEVSKSVTREIIDSKGMAVGVATPQWVEYAVESDYAKLGAYPEFEGKTIYLAENQGKNLDLLKSWVRNFEINGAFSRALSNSVLAKFGGSLEGENLEERKSYLNEVVATFSKTTFSGLEMKKDYWVQSRIHDKDNKSTEDIYQYFVVYSIDSKDLREQLDVALGRVEARTEEQKKMKDEIRSAMQEIQLFSEGR